MDNDNIDQFFYSTFFLEKLNLYYNVNAGFLMSCIKFKQNTVFLL
jgi:hypothetical protein